MEKIGRMRTYLKSMPLIGKLYRLIGESDIYYRMHYMKPGGPYWQYDYKSIKFDRLIRKVASQIDDNNYSINISADGSVYITLENGIKFKWNPKDPYSLLGMPLRGNFEPECTHIINRLVKNGDTVVDIGANFGWYTNHLANLVGDAGQVHAFEPTNIIADLRDNVLLNGFEKRCIINTCALGNMEGTETLFMPERLGTAFASLRKQIYRGSSQTSSLTVSIRMLDSYVNENKIEKINLIKIDTEGAEFMILKGAENTIKKYHPIILFELLSHHTLPFGYSPIELIDYLSALCYDTYELDSNQLGKLIRVKSFEDTRNYNFIAFHRDFYKCMDCEILQK
jgi:FkbM family methyltransferase